MNNEEYREVRVIKNQGKRLFVAKFSVENLESTGFAFDEIKEFYSSMHKHFISCLTQSVANGTSIPQHEREARFVCRIAYASEKYIIYTRDITVTCLCNVEYRLTTTDTFSTEGRLIQDVSKRRIKKMVNSREKDSLPAKLKKARG